MIEFACGLIGMIIFFCGFTIGRIQGWSLGYDKALKDASKEVDDYFEAKCMCRTIQKAENNEEEAKCLQEMRG